MSRVGKQPITIPVGVTVTVDEALITVTGPKGSLSQSALPGINVQQDSGVLTVTRNQDDPKSRSQHGLQRSLINNMVRGVQKGFDKSLEVNGVGYRINLQGANLKFNLGFSHEISYAIPTGITINVEQNVIKVSGINRQQVGQVAAEIRALKKPEPYKGKGIKYVNERILRKSGKSGKEK